MEAKAMEDHQDVDFIVCCGKTKVKFKWYWEDYIKLAYLLNNPDEAYMVNSSGKFSIEFEAPQHFFLKTQFSPTQETVCNIMDNVKQEISANKAAVMVDYNSTLYQGLEAYLLHTELSKHKLVYLEKHHGIIYVAVNRNRQKELYSVAEMSGDEPGSPGRAQTDKAGMQASGGSGSGSQKQQGKSSISIENCTSWSCAGTTVQVVNVSSVAVGIKNVVDMFETKRTTGEVQMKKEEGHCTIQFPVTVEKLGKLDTAILTRNVYKLLETVGSDPVEIKLDSLKQVPVKKFLKTVLKIVLKELKDEEDYGTTRKYSINFCTNKLDTLQDAIQACDKMLQTEHGWQKKEPIVQRKKKRRVEIKLERGTLEDMKADILACTLSEGLDLEQGQASRALLKAAGRSIQGELDKKRQDFSITDGIVVTSAGRLPCKNLCFGVLLPYSWKDDYDKKGADYHAQTSVHDFMTRCLQIADAKKAVTIAFPAIGSGRLQYPIDVVAEAMYKAVEMYSADKPVYHLQQVIFVVHYDDDDAWDVFKLKQKAQDGTPTTNTGVVDDTASDKGSTDGPQAEQNCKALASVRKTASQSTRSTKDEAISSHTTKERKQNEMTSCQDDKECLTNSFRKQKHVQAEEIDIISAKVGQLSLDEDDDQRNTGKGISQNLADDLSSSFRNNEQLSKHKVSVPPNISRKCLEYFLSGILTKYRKKEFTFDIKSDCIEYEGPSELHSIFKTEFHSARSNISNIQTDSLAVKKHNVGDDFDSIEFESDGVFLEYVPEENVINFHGLQWNDIQKVKRIYQTRLCPQNVRVRGERHLNQNHCKTNEHDDGDMSTSHRGEKHDTNFPDAQVGVQNGARQKTVTKVSDKGPTTPESEFSWSRHTSDLTVYSVKDVTVKVYSADILHVPVDCIVNAANSQLNHHGGVAKFIAKAAGKKLKQEGEDYIKKHGSLKVGEGCHTSAGKLPYKHVIHAVGPCWSWYTPHAQADVLKCENDLRMAIKNSLSKAEILGHSSIAIPAVSSGKFGCPEDFCAVQYAYAIHDYVSTSISPIQEIHFVDTNRDIVGVIHHAFRAMLRKDKPPKDYDSKKYILPQPPPKKPGLKRFLSVPSKSTQEKTRRRTTYQDDYGQPYPYCEPPSQLPAGHEVFTCFFGDNKKLLVYTDNILTLRKQFDMKACGENASGNGKGFLSTEFAKQGGALYQSAKRTAFKGKKPGDVVVCKADKNHKCKFIAHVVLPQGTDDDTKMDSTFRELFKAMVTNKCETLALPLLGTGKARLPATYVIKRLYESLKEFSKASGNKTHPIEVHLVSRDRDTNIVISTIQGEVGNVRASQATGYDRRTGPDTHSSTGAGGARLKSASMRQKHPSNTTEHQPSTRVRYDRSKTETSLHKRSRNHQSPSNKFSFRGSDESDSSSDSESKTRYVQRKPLDKQSSADTEQSSMSVSQKGKKGNLLIYQSDSGEEDSANACHSLKPSDEKTVQKPAADVDSDSSGSDVDNCVICMDVVTDPKTLSCGHKFCTDCIDAQFAYKKVCPTCGAVCGIITGDQPDGTMDVYTHTKYPGCAGYEKYGKIQITYTFQNGVQQSNHPSPSKPYRGIKRTGYLPDTKRGRQILEMLRVAFDRKLVFTIGNSRTTGQQGVITWNDIHHKTDPSPNTPFGYPDPTYLDRVEDELKAKGVTVADIKSSPDVYRSTKM